MCVVRVRAAGLVVAFQMSLATHFMQMHRTRELVVWHLTVTLFAGASMLVVGTNSCLAEELGQGFVREWAVSECDALLKWELQASQDVLLFCLFHIMPGCTAHAAPDATVLLAAVLAILLAAGYRQPAWQAGSRVQYCWRCCWQQMAVPILCMCHKWAVCAAVGSNGQLL